MVGYLQTVQSVPSYQTSDVDTIGARAKNLRENIVAGNLGSADLDFRILRDTIVGMEFPGKSIRHVRAILNEVVRSSIAGGYHDLRVIAESYMRQLPHPIEKRETTQVEREIIDGLEMLAVEGALRKARAQHIMDLRH